jgi:hypothetical protein
MVILRPANIIFIKIWNAKDSMRSA